jgi:WxcM-like protein
MNKLEQIKLSSHKDERGTLTVAELKDYIDWPVARVYYLTDVAGPRGGHAVRNEKKIYVCQKGTVKARLHDGNDWQEFELHGPDDALIMREMCYRDFYEFSEDAVLLALSSVNYKEDDYIYDLDAFINEVSQ